MQFDAKTTLAVVAAALSVIMVRGQGGQDSIEEEFVEVIRMKSSSPSSISNCFGLVDTKGWDLVTSFNRDEASLRLNAAAAGPSALLACLENQAEKPYVLSLLRETASSNETVNLQTVTVNAAALRENPVVLKPVYVPGRYRMSFCPTETVVNGPESTEDVEIVPCPSSLILSEVLVEIGQDELPCDIQNASSTSNSSRPRPTWETRVDADSITFRLSFDPCLPRNVTLDLEVLTRLRKVALSRGDCHANGTLVPLAFSSDGDGEGTSILNVTESSQPLKYDKVGQGFLEFTTAEHLAGNHFYCLEFSLADSHPLCAQKVDGDSVSDTPAFCAMRSHPVFVDTKPFIAYYIPYCTSNFRCGWLYVLVIGAALLITSWVLACCCVYCCCRKGGKSSKHAKKHPDRHRDETIPFEGLCLNDPVIYTPKKTWLELHTEWDTAPPKNPGKILLLYSPDSKSYKGLQSQLKDFIQTACHCIVLDLFDDELFETIAFDPELWIANLLKDPDFKIIVMCSEGAYKRQQSQIKGEVLNIPDNSSMDGLFSAGLKFIQDKHAYDYNRLALARYEMLSLTGPEFRLQEMVPNREFLVPTQLHELFCWIHGLDPLDLLGKPWARYHLELQLLQDSLKQTRLEQHR